MVVVAVVLMIKLRDEVTSFELLKKVCRVLACWQMSACGMTAMLVVASGARTMMSWYWMTLQNA